MVATFCTSGENEGLKGGVHAAACGLAVVMTAYNSAAWWYRRERHLSINSVLYATAAAWEIVQVRRHWSRLAAIRRAGISNGSRSAAGGAENRTEAA